MIEGSRVKWREVELLNSNVEQSGVKKNHGRELWS